MKTDMKVIVGVMIAVILAGGLFLWGQGRSEEEILQSLDPESYDVELTCIEKDGQHLVCNEGQDTFLLYDDVQVYVKKMDTVVKENGDEITTTTYKTSSTGKLEKALEKRGSVLLHLWLTEQGQIESLMMVETSFTNNNATLKNLEGLDPGSYHGTNVILSMHRRGMKLAPVNYTEMEKEKFEEMVNDYAFAKNVRFYQGIVTTSEGEDGELLKNTQYGKLNYSTVKSMDKPVTAHIWFNENGKITHVLVHKEVKK